MTEGYLLGPKTVEALGALLRRPEWRQAVLAAQGRRAAPGFFLECWRGLIVAQGPAQEADYTDERYWIKRAKATCTGGPANRITLAALAAEDPAYLHVTATNLAELASATHSLPAGTGVQVFALSDTQTPPVKHYYFCCGGAATGLWEAKLTGAVLIAPNRWAYPWVEQVLNENGTWVTKPGGYTSAGSGAAYNTMEAFNTATGVQGCGINVDNLPAGWSLRPIGPAVVQMRFVLNCHGVPEATFSAPNQPDGTC